MPRIVANKTLADLLPKGTEGAKEFARIVDLLLFHVARKNGKSLTLIDDSAGDFAGLDSFVGATRRTSNIGYQYKFYPCPLSDEHRAEIKAALDTARKTLQKSRISKWILVTPEDFIESSSRKSGGDVSWFEELKGHVGPALQIEHWGHKAIQALFIENPSLALFYYPDLVPGAGALRKSLSRTRQRYDCNLDATYRKIQFVGMSVYKEGATRGVAMENIYIPLQLVPSTAQDEDDETGRIDPLHALRPGQQTVILGDPGSGKSTLLRFLTLVGQIKSLQKRVGAKSDKNRLPILVTLRRYADELKSRPYLPLIDHIVETTQADFNLASADAQFFGHYLESGQAILCFDGLDELPSPHFKQVIRDRITSMSATYPGNTYMVSSRIVGYDEEIRFDQERFAHYRVAKLRLPEIEQFISDWYAVRVDSTKERDENIQHLVGVMNSEDSRAIQELARNPLLLTIIALVHRIDADLPDERVVLYQKCTETLLNTWHTWKYRASDDQPLRKRAERRNRLRMESLAYWMHERSTASGRLQRAVVPYSEAHDFLAKYITDNERIPDGTDAEDLSEAFLEFVKRRAGLLIEVGDDMYSFVHLTFQEYLASAHICTLSEKGGAASLWGNIEGRTASDRWQETIRLTLASLRASDTREYLLMHLLHQAQCEPNIGRIELLLGCLSDGVEEVEDRSAELFSLAIAAAVELGNLPDVNLILSKLRSLTRKNPAYLSAVRNALSTFDRLQDLEHRVALRLVAVGIDASELAMDLDPVAPDPQGNPTDAYVQTLLGKCALPKLPDDMETRVEAMRSEASLLTQDSTARNLIAMASMVVPFSVSQEVASRYALRLLLSSLAVNYIGPWHDTSLNLLRLWARSGDLFLADLQKSLPARPHVPRRALGRIGSRVIGALNPIRTRFIHSSHKTFISGRDADGLQALSVGDLDQSISMDSFLFSGAADRSKAGELVIWDHRPYVSTIARFVLIYLQLAPKPLWLRALTNVFATRANELGFQPELSRSLVDEVRQGRMVHAAAVMLLVDSWARDFGLGGSAKPHVDDLAGAAAAHGSPLLLFILWLRDCAYRRRVPSFIASNLMNDKTLQRELNASFVIRPELAAGKPPPIIDIEVNPGKTAAQRR